MKRPAVLSGKREVTIVRVESFESGVTLNDGRLTEADDDSGRQLFVPTPIKGDTYLIKAYGPADGSATDDQPICWEEHNPGATDSLTVQGTECDPTNPGQQFTIAPVSKGARTYAISNRSAFLQSLSSGLVLQEIGDAPLESTFRLVDNGAARE